MGPLYGDGGGYSAMPFVEAGQTNVSHTDRTSSRTLAMATAAPCHEEMLLNDRTHAPDGFQSPTAARRPKRLTTHWVKPTQYFIDPGKSELKSAFDVALSVSSIVAALVTPYNAAFGAVLTAGEISAIALMDLFVDIVFALDIVLNFFTGYFTDERPGYIETSSRKIVLRYLAGWFVPDLLAVSPGIISLFTCLFATGRSEKAVTALHFLRVMRLLRLTRMMSVMALARKWQSISGASHASISLINFIVMLALTCHLMACLWGWTAVQELGETNVWLAAVQSSKGGDPCLYEEAQGIYCMALYWAIMSITSIGYGDIVPQNPREYWMASCCMVMMAGLWTYVIGQVCGVVSTLMPHDVEFKRTMDDLNWLMEDRNVPHEHRVELRQYFQQLKALSRAKGERALIAQMSPMLQGKVSLQMFEGWSAKVRYMRHMEPHVLVRLTRKIIPVLYAPKEEVIGDRTLFVIRRGLALKGGKVRCAGDVWGQDMIIGNYNLRDCSTARCISYLEAFTLAYADLMSVVDNFPRERRVIKCEQAWLALSAGMAKIGAAAKMMTKHSSLRLNIWDLTDRQRLYLYTEAIKGTFDGIMPETCQLHKLNRLPSLLRASFLTGLEVSSTLNNTGVNESTRSPEPEQHDEVLELLAHQAKEIQEMKVAMDQIKSAMGMLLEKFS